MTPWETYNTESVGQWSFVLLPSEEKFGTKHPEDVEMGYAGDRPGNEERSESTRYRESSVSEDEVGQTPQQGQSLFQFWSFHFCVNFAAWSELILPGLRQKASTSPSPWNIRPILDQSDKNKDAKHAVGSVASRYEELRYETVKVKFMPLA